MTRAFRPRGVLVRCRSALVVVLASCLVVELGGDAQAQTGRPESMVGLCKSELQVPPSSIDYQRQLGACVARRMQQRPAERRDTFEPKPPERLIPSDRHPAVSRPVNVALALRIARELPGASDSAAAGAAEEQRVLCRKGEAVSSLNGRPTPHDLDMEEGLPESLRRYAAEPQVWKIIEAWGRLNLAKGLSELQCPFINQHVALTRLNETIAGARPEDVRKRFLRRNTLLAISNEEAKIMEPIEQAVAASAAAAVAQQREEGDRRRRETGPVGDQR